MQDEFDDIPGVVSTEVGYTGGSQSHPTYEQVCSGGTGHTEAVKVTFDTKKLSYRSLVGAFLKNHSPLFGNFFTHGGQYKTVIFTNSDHQDVEAKAALADAEKSSGRKVSVDLLRAGTFWKAEDYHQHYNKKHGMGSCSIH